MVSKTVKLADLSKAIKQSTIFKIENSYATAIPEWSRIAAEEAKDLIVETITRGQSPVEGGRGQTGNSARFYDYSQMYKAMIESARKNTGKIGRPGRRRKAGSTLNVMKAYGKRLRPVNLKLTGEMLKSIRSRMLKDGFKIFFTSPLAAEHTIEGVGRRKIKRKMLPVDKGDVFTRLINKGIADRFNSILLKKLRS